MRSGPRSAGRSRLIGLSALGLLLLVSCSGEPDPPDDFVLIYDDGALLSQASEERLEAFSAEADSPIRRLVIATSEEFDPARLSIEGDRAASRINRSQFLPWRVLFPRNRKAVTLVYSREPDLLQIRYGRSLRGRARAAGITSGEGYAALQAIRSPDGSPDLLAVAQDVQARLSETEVSALRSFASFFVTIFGDEMVELVAIPQFELWDGMASIAAIPIYNALTRVTPNYFIFTIAVVGFVFLVWGLLMPLFARFGDEVAPGSFHASTGTGCAVYLAGFAVLLITAFPMFGLLVLSSNTRAEDLIMSDAIGLERPFPVPTHLDWWWILLLILVTWVARFVPLLFGLDVDDAELGQAAVKSLFVTPVAYFVMPAWLVFFFSVATFWGGLLMWIVRSRW